MSILRWGLVLLVGCQPAPVPPVTGRANSSETSSRAPQLISERSSADSEVHSTTGRLPLQLSVSNVINSRETEAINTPGETVYREDDHRPVHNDAELKELGIEVYSSRHLKLYSDLAPSAVENLPELVDQLYKQWDQFFGPVLPARDGRPLQLTGYLMQDTSLFREAGLLPHDLPGVLHGRHRGREFWLNNPTTDYYRRHLLLHEATHGFMTLGMRTDPPLWYFEGMAELFAVHQLEETGAAQFFNIPKQKKGFEGWGRIEILQQEIQHNRAASVRDMLSWKAADFASLQGYASTWAFCEWLRQHPRYNQRFRELGRSLIDARQTEQFNKLFAADLPELEREWIVFQELIDFGIEVSRCLVNFPSPNTLRRNPAEHVSATIASDHAWQPVNVEVDAGRTLEWKATGRYIVAQTPVPWECEPNGVSIRYVRGRPCGQLLGLIIPSQNQDQSSNDWRGPFPMFVVGKSGTFVAPVTGQVFVRVNDAPGELGDNQGTANLNVRVVP